MTPSFRLYTLLIVDRTSLVNAIILQYVVIPVPGTYEVFKPGDKVLVDTDDGCVARNGYNLQLDPTDYRLFA